MRSDDDQRSINQSKMTCMDIYLSGILTWKTWLVFFCDQLRQLHERTCPFHTFHGFYRRWQSHPLIHCHWSICHKQHRLPKTLFPLLPHLLSILYCFPLYCFLVLSPYIFRSLVRVMLTNLSVTCTKVTLSLPEFYQSDLSLIPFRDERQLHVKQQAQQHTCLTS